MVDAIQIGLSGLRVNQAALAVTSNNLANASTEGYTRKEFQRESIVLEGNGNGVRAGQLRRTINEYIQRDVWTQTSNQAGFALRETYLNQIQEFHGNPNANASIAADINKLKSEMQKLAGKPEDRLQLDLVYNQATRTTKRMNDFSNQITQMRNDTQAEISQTVTTINSLLQQIATFNKQIQSSNGLGTSSADIEDQRDQAVKELSKEISITSYKRDDGTLQILSSTGDDLVTNSANKLIFNPQALGTGSYYPATASAVYINSNVGPNLTNEDRLGGKLGELIKLRDKDLPVYQAQIDELAHKMATRFAEQGLKLFTSPDGTIPANTPSSYVGFAAAIRINPDVVSDRTLIRKGTEAGSTVQEGGADILRKIIDYAFGSVDYQQALGTVDLRSTAAQNVVRGTRNIQALGPLDAASTNITSGSADTFALTVNGVGPTNITIGATDTAANLVNTINTAFAGLASLNSSGKLVLSSQYNITLSAGTLGSAGLADLGLTAGAYTPNLQSYLNLPPEARIVGTTDIQSLGMLEGSTVINPGTQDTFSIALGSGTPVNIVIGANQNAADLVNTINTALPGLASVGAGGQLILSASQNITIAAGTLGTAGIAELGLSAGVTNTTNPKFSIAVGLNAQSEIEITPTETTTTLLAKLNAVTGVEASIDSSGFLLVRPLEGGNLSLIDGQGTPLESLGMARSDISHASFNSTNLGPTSSLNGRILGAKTLFDFATQMVSVQSQDAALATSELATSETFKNQLETQLVNQSGVNVDAEMADLITLQTAYNASANAIRIAQAMLDQLTELFQR